MLAAELTPMRIQGVATASMAYNPTGFVNQASGNIAGGVIQTNKYSVAQRSFTPTSVSSALQFQPASAPSAIPLAASVPQVRNAQAAAKIRSQLGRLAAGGVQLTTMLQQIHEEALTEKDRENPHTKRHRLATILNWATLLQVMFPDMPETNYWHTDTVRTFAKTYLRLRVSQYHIIIYIKY